MSELTKRVPVSEKTLNMLKTIQKANGYITYDFMLNKLLSKEYQAAKNQI